MLRQDVQAACFGLHFDWIAKHSAVQPGLAQAVSQHAVFITQFTQHPGPSSTPVIAAVTRSQAQPSDLSTDTDSVTNHEDLPSDYPLAVYGQNSAESKSLIPELREAYLQDPMFGNPDDPPKHKHLRARNGVWYRDQVIAVPNSPAIKRQILTELHESKYAGHGGEFRTVQLVRRYFWWPSLDNDCRAFVKGCAQCQRNKASTRRYAGLLQQHDMATQKWEQVSMDFITHLPKTAAGNDMILVVVDTLTKMTHFIPCTEHCTAEDTARLLLQHVFRLHGWPRVWITDRDTRFTEPMFRALCTQLGTRQAMGTVKHPETDGQTERMNRVLEETLRHYVNDRMDNWDVLLPTAEFAVNNSFQQSIRTTPFYLNYGYHPNVPLDVGVCQEARTDAFLQDNQFVLEATGKYFAFAQQRLMADRIAALVQDAKANLMRARNRQKQYADAKRSELSFSKGDRVMLKTSLLNLRTQPSKKLFPLWLGPFEIDSVVSSVSYRLVLPVHWKIHDVFHVNLLKPWRDNGQDHPPSPFTYLGGQWHEYEVDYILDHRPKSILVQRDLPNKVLNRLEFRVRWKYAGPQHDTWEPYKHMRHAPESVTAYGF